MSVTYSIKVGTPYEAKRIVDIEDVLKQLPDNTNKEISPKDVRDAFLSTWANSPFKLTTIPSSNNSEYIGIDSGNPAGRDIKQKMFFGKRQLLGKDIMNNVLLSYDTDIYFYNTKADGVTQSTKISILSGTYSDLFRYAPYIESKSNGLRTDLIIRNPSTYSNINIESATGRVSINGISFPTIDESKNFTGGLDNKVLKYQGTFPNGYLKWDSTNIDNLNIGNSTSKIELKGATVSLNGFDLEFYDTRMVPKSIGGVQAGVSFSNYPQDNKKWPLSEVLRKLLYTYVPPQMEINVYNTSTGLPYFERNVTTPITIDYSVSVYSIDLFTNNKINQTNGCVITKNGKIKIFDVSETNPISFSKPGDFTRKQLTYTQSSDITKQTYHLYISDNNTRSLTEYLTGFTHSATASMYPINPIYYGFTSSILTNIIMTNTAFNSNFKKIILPTPGTGSSVFADYKGDGYLYFCYPKDSIDSNGNTILFGTPSMIADAQSFNFKYYISGSSTSIFTYSLTYSTSNSCTYSMWRTIDKVGYPDTNQLEFKF